MKHFVINEPFWMHRSVSVAICDVQPGWNSVECTHVKKDGKREFPGVYYFNSSIIKDCKTDVKKGVTLAILPSLDNVDKPGSPIVRCVPRETATTVWCGHTGMCDCLKEANDTIERNEAQAAGNAVPTRPFPCVHEALLRRDDNDYECAGCGQLFNMMISLRIGG